MFEYLYIDFLDSLDTISDLKERLKEVKNELKREINKSIENNIFPNPFLIGDKVDINPFDFFWKTILIIEVSKGKDYYFPKIEWKNYFSKNPDNKDILMVRIDWEKRTYKWRNMLEYVQNNPRK